MAEENRRQLFHEWVQSHARGSLDADATAELAKVVQAVADLGKSGKLVVELLVEPADQDGRVVAIGGRITAKPPQPNPAVSIYYPDEAGGLHRDDPYQKRLPGLKPGERVDAGTGEIITDEGAVE